MNSPYSTAEAVGFPIRKFPDQSLLSSSPKHIAACHVLHRLLVPRHPPNALSSLLYASLLTRKIQVLLTPFLFVGKVKSVLMDRRSTPVLLPFPP